MQIIRIPTVLLWTNLRFRRQAKREVKNLKSKEWTAPELFLSVPQLLRKGENPGKSNPIRSTLSKSKRVEYNNSSKIGVATDLLAEIKFDLSLKHTDGSSLNKNSYRLPSEPCMNGRRLHRWRLYLSTFYYHAWSMRKSKSSRRTTVRIEGWPCPTHVPPLQPVPEPGIRYPLPDPRTGGESRKWRNQE